MTFLALRVFRAGLQDLLCHVHLPLQYVLSCNFTSFLTSFVDDSVTRVCAENFCVVADRYCICDKEVPATSSMRARLAVAALN